MTATIHPLHGEILPREDTPSYWNFVHEIAMKNLHGHYLRKTATVFGQLVIDESMKSGNSYLAQEASRFLEFVQSLERAG